MRALIQRVNRGEVEVDAKVVGACGKGFVILVGIEADDTGEDVQWLASKISNLRIFNDEDGLMNLSIKDISGSVLLISQFTLHASTKKGNRPSFIKAARPQQAEPLYLALGKALEAEGLPVQYGRFGAHMNITLVNDGPVTIWMDSKNKE